MRSAFVLCAGLTFLYSFQADAGVLPNILQESVPDAKFAVDTLVIKTLELAEFVLNRVPGSDNNFVQNYVVDSKKWIKRKLYEDVLKKLEKFTEEFSDGTNAVLSEVETLKNVTDGVIATLSRNLVSTFSMAKNNIDSEVEQWQESLQDALEPTMENIIKPGVNEMSNLFQISQETRIDLSECYEIHTQLLWEEGDFIQKIEFCTGEFLKPYNIQWKLLEERVSKITNELSEVMNRSAECVRTPNTSSVRKAYCLTENIMKSMHKMMDSKGELTESLLSDIKSFAFTSNPNKYCIPEDNYFEVVERLKSMLDQAQQCTSERIQK